MGHKDAAALSAIETELPAVLDLAAGEYRGRDFVRALAGCSGYVSYKAYEGQSETEYMDFEEGWLRADRERLKPRQNYNRPKMTWEENVNKLYSQIKNLIGQEAGVDPVWRTPRGEVIAHILTEQLGREARRFFNNTSNSRDAWAEIEKDFYEGWRVSAREEQSS